MLKIFSIFLLSTLNTALSYDSHDSATPHQETGAMKMTATPINVTPFTDTKSDAILQFEQEIAYFFEAENPKPIKEHYINAIGIFTAAKYQSQQTISGLVTPYLVSAYTEIQKQTGLNFSIETAARYEFDLIWAQSQKCSQEDIREIMVKLYTEIFQTTNDAIEKAARLRTFLYSYKIAVQSMAAGLQDSDVALLKAIAQQSEQELKTLYPEKSSSS